MASSRVIPPLSQSLVEMGSCPESYVFQIIDGNRQPDSIQSYRGTEVHHVLSEYVRHCVARKVAQDFAAFDKLSSAAGPVAGPILDNMRDTLTVDWKHVLMTEVRLRLDEDLKPTTLERISPSENITHNVDEIPGVAYSTEPAAHAGTLDVIEINDDATEATIPDYKSHPRPFEPDTYQSMLYPFMLMKHLPTVNKVTFELIFVRYGGAVRRSVVWTREDMPTMAVEIRRARERQLALEDAGQGPALPGKHCQYCPKASRLDLCSIADFNPEVNTSFEERYRMMIWWDQVRKINAAVLKDHIDATGRPVRITDANGKIYEYGIHPVESKIFPLEPISFKILSDHIKTSPKDDWHTMKLLIGSTKLKSLLKAKFREGLAQAFDDSVVEMVVKPKYASRLADGEIDAGPGFGGDEDDNDF